MWYRYFFIVFYYYGVIIGLNIIIAFAIDMYSAVQRLEDQKESNRLYLVELAKTQHSDFVNQNKVDPKDLDVEDDIWVTPTSANDVAMTFNLNDDDVDEVNLIAKEKKL